MTAETKIKTLSAIVSKLKPKDLHAELEPHELRELHHKVSKALELHEDEKSQKKKPSEMTDREFSTYRDRLFAAQGDDNSNHRKSK